VEVADRRAGDRLLRKAIYAFVTGAQPPIGSLRRTDPQGEAATR
jgi:hypothetical protein